MKNKKIISLILDIVIIGLCFINIFFNFDNYKYLINNNYGILNSIADLDNKFIYADLTYKLFLSNFKLFSALAVADIKTLLY